jgi:ribosomal-protein-alanine N-acetyltransferase
LINSTVLIVGLSSERLVFKKCDPADLEDYLRFGTDPEVMKYVTPRPLSREQAIFRYKKALAINKKSDKLGYWLAYAKETNELVAYLKMVDIWQGFHEIGYLVLPECWGEKYASELVCALVEYACTLESVSVLVGIVQVENVASRRVLEKCGFDFFKSGMFEGAKADFLKLDVI